jgi:hypothetical protein
MTLKTHSGSCHCGAVRFEADVDVAQGMIKCNCSSCAKARSWLAFVPASRYRLTAGAEFQANYQWTPPGKPAPTIEFHFCKICGIRTPGRGECDKGGAFYAVQVPLLNDVDPEELAAGPVQYVDGLHDPTARRPIRISYEPCLPGIDCAALMSVNLDSFRLTATSHRLEGIGSCEN